MTDCTALRCHLPSDAVLCNFMEQEPEGWSRRLSTTIAAEVRRHRVAAGMSTQQLSDKCAALGHEIPRPVLSNLENGRRENVSIAEILVLSAALKITPASLIFPVGYTSEAEPLPGVQAHPLDAVFWFSGESDRLMGHRADQEADASGGARVEIVAAREGGMVWVDRPDGMRSGTVPMIAARTLAETAAAIEDQQKQAQLIRSAAGRMASDELAERTSKLADQVEQKADEYAQYLDRFRQGQEGAFPEVDLSYPSPSALSVRPLNFGSTRGRSTAPMPDVIFEDRT